MLHRIREPFGKAGLIVAVVALVAALVGGAYAASGGLTGKQKKEVKKIAQQFAGRNGEQGPAGQAGSQGPRGDAGAAGANGINGKDGEKGETGQAGKDGENGKSVSIFPIAPGGEGCEETGGAKFTNGTDTAYACNGKDGTSSSYPEVLPSGRTMEGYWEIQGENGFVFGPGWSITTISYPLPLATATSETIVIKTTSTEEEKTKCPGSLENPQATPGVLCLYPVFAEMTLATSLPSTFGATLAFPKTEEGYGSWAVKAP